MLDYAKAVALMLTNPVLLQLTRDGSFKK
ncbi:MAG: hypothetical protein WKF88_05265 [Ferruginibacter sp.]